MKIELNETEQQYLIDSMMFYSTFMQYFKNDNRGSYSRLIKQYQYWYDKDDRKECQQIFEKVLNCLLYTSPSPRDDPLSRMPSSA